MPCVHDESKKNILLKMFCKEIVSCVLLRKQDLLVTKFYNVDAPHFYNVDAPQNFTNVDAPALVYILFKGNFQRRPERTTDQCTVMNHGNGNKPGQA